MFSVLMPPCGTVFNIPSSPTMTENEFKDSSLEELVSSWLVNSSS